MVIKLPQQKNSLFTQISPQEKLLAAQEKRRNISQHLQEIRKRSNDLQDQIHNVKRQENLQRFLDLMKEETEVLKLEEEINAQFQECDREEREIFSAFTNAVRDSHEKQRAQVEYTKYFGIILSIVGSLLTFCYSSVKKHDLKRCIEQNIAKIGTIPAPTLVDQIQNALGTLPVVVNNKNSEITQMIANSTGPLLNEFQKSQTELKAIKKLLLDRGFFLPVIRELERTQKELKEIKQVLKSGGQYVARIPAESAMFNRFEEVSEDSNTRQYVFIGLASLGMILVLKTLCG